MHDGSNQQREISPLLMIPRLKLAWMATLDESREPVLPPVALVCFMFLAPLPVHILGSLPPELFIQVSRSCWPLFSVTMFSLPLVCPRHLYALIYANTVRFWLLAASPSFLGLQCHPISLCRPTLPLIPSLDVPARHTLRCLAETVKRVKAGPRSTSGPVSMPCKTPSLNWPPHNIQLLTWDFPAGSMPTRTP